MGGVLQASDQVISASSRFRASDDVIYQTIGDEVVVLNLVNQHYYGLDELGAAVWQFLVDNLTLGEITDRVLQAYEVSPDVLSGDLLALLGDLHEAGLLIAVGN